MQYPTSPDQWVRMAALDVLEFPPSVGQAIWSMTRGETANADGSVGHSLHVVTVTYVSSESLGVRYEDGESSEVTMANLVDDVTFHNGLVRTRLEKIGEESGKQSATTAPTEAVMSAANSAVETTVSLQTTIAATQESASSHTPLAPTTGPLCPQPQLQNSMPEQTHKRNLATSGQMIPTQRHHHHHLPCWISNCSCRNAWLRSLLSVLLNF